jgi:pimeloyl-ACP methyl ester carboxylesterase
MPTRRDVLARGAGAVAVMVQAGGASGQAVVEEVWIKAGLAGTLMRPDAHRGPAVLIIAGSGPTDRNGNGPLIRTDSYRLLAAALAQAGIRSLRYDKRGIGESRDLVVREETLRFDHFVNDAAVAARDLADRPDVSGVVLVGHSEGALIATMAEALVPVAGLILIAAPGRPMREVLREQLDGAPVPSELRAEALNILAALSTGAHVDNVAPELAPLFRTSVQPYLASLINIDPAAELARVSVPVLLLNGARDLQVTLADRDALVRAGRNVRTVTLPEANHVLKRAPADRAGNVSTYTDPSIPLDPGVAPAVIDFVRAVAG